MFGDLPMTGVRRRQMDSSGVKMMLPRLSLGASFQTNCARVVPELVLMILKFV